MPIEYISHKSEVSPLVYPTSPDFVDKNLSASSGVIFKSLIRKITTLGSMLPNLVPITSPGIVPHPIEESTVLPF